MDKSEQLQLLLDLTADYINEIALTDDLKDLNSLELFEEAISLALLQYKSIIKKPKKYVTIGRVDTSKMAFSLQDEQTVAVIQGDIEFAENLDIDYIGGEEPITPDEEF